jgi:ubiquitin carboxyl-terminal hydrolase 4/11/15
MSQEKIGDLVDFPVTGLDARRFIKTDSPSKDPIYYDLYAVSNHFGSLHGGHYTAYGFNSLMNKWYEFNDSSVGSVHDPSDVVTNGAYLLFYRKRE